MCVVCKEGYHGESCEQKCGFPWYGLGCQKKCNCIDKVCDHVKGCFPSSKGRVKIKSKSNVFFGLFKQLCRKKKW